MKVVVSYTSTIIHNVITDIVYHMTPYGLANCMYDVRDTSGDNYIVMVAAIAHITIHIYMVTMSTSCKQLRSQQMNS